MLVSILYLLPSRWRPSYWLMPLRLLCNMVGTSSCHELMVEAQLRSKWVGALGSPQATLPKFLQIGWNRGKSSLFGLPFLSLFESFLLLLWLLPIRQVSISCLWETNAHMQLEGLGKWKWRAMGTVTALLSCSVVWDVLPIQVIFQGKTHRCVPKGMEA